MQKPIDAIHHTGILTRDLDGLERRYLDLGFTLSPRSRHLLSARPGEPPTPGCTANRCALFGGAYLELLGIVDESAPDPWHTKAMADEYEGFRLLNLETGDAESARRQLAAAGVPASGVLDLEREVETEDGIRVVRARAVHVDPRSTPEALLGVAQHLTREYVHQPRYLSHPNGARAIAAVLIVGADAEFDAIVERYSRVLAVAAVRKGPLTVLEMGAGRLELVRASEAPAVLPGEPAPAPSYLAAMTIAVHDPAVARDIVGNAGVPVRETDEGFFVSARDAYGAGLFFVAG
ncbi:VOC family protein [Nocardia arthritidis]|uniref:VOC family protein n=1 Tax=Nocardia arthritidis TaxID=228602 RepID=UPI000AE88534|nr:VOC family protein [Nocardia arthritidis]